MTRINDVVKGSRVTTAFLTDNWHPGPAVSGPSEGDTEVRDSQYLHQLGPVSCHPSRVNISQLAINISSLTVVESIAIWKRMVFTSFTDIVHNNFMICNKFQEQGQKCHKLPITIFRVHTYVKYLLCYKILFSTLIVIVIFPCRITKIYTKNCVWVQSGQELKELCNVHWTKRFHTHTWRVMTCGEILSAIFCNNLPSEVGVLR